MLAKPNKSQASHKKEVAERVKEIKQRQQNWFKQREESIQKEPSPSPDHQPSKKTYKLGTDPFAPTKHVSKESRAINRQTVTVKKSKLSATQNEKTAPSTAAGFHAWRTRQANNIQEADTKEEETDSDQYAETESTDIPVYSDVESYRSGVSSRANSSQADVAAGTLSPDQFDALADQIITRVKNELHVDSSRTSLSKNGHTKQPLKYEEHKYSKPEEHHHPVTSGLDSHFCPSCSELMMPPRFEPMLVIPCGHTLCCQCLRGQSACLLCGCDINSLTCNIMLQQIIIDYSKKPKANNGSGSSKSTLAMGDSSANRGSVHSDGRDFEEEYKTLVIRCEVLKAEEDSINERISIIKENTRQEQAQVDSITKEEKRTEHKIMELQHKLEALRSHRQDYIEKCEVFKQKEEEEICKLKLCKDTLTQLKKEADKIKLMAGRVHTGNSNH